jgi:hypothetical protein
MWLKGSARKAPAQRHLLQKRPFFYPSVISLASFCWRKIEKVIAPSARVRFHAVRAHPRKGAMSALGLGCVKTVLLVVRAEDKCEQDAARA